ncbi:MAG: pirin-like C-terminal cupin domain-containing protein [Lautropia sp.]|nr:pirin-like C-terminal cupin domain-containing protein [Lautropia sp.]
MQKPAIGTSLPLSPATPSHAAWQEQSFFAWSGLGRQANPLIQASLIPAQKVSAGTEQSTQPVAQAGFESVYFVLQGEQEVRDSSAPEQWLSGTAGDVLWQGTGRGVLTEKRIGSTLARQGGTLEAVNLWVNLPAAYKTSDPHHQVLKAADIPVISLPDEAGTLRLIAGSFDGQTGPAETVTPVQCWDVSISAGKAVKLPLHHRWYAQVLLLRGSLKIDFVNHLVTAPTLVALDAAGDELCCQAKEDVRMIVLCSEPVDEPLVGRDELVFASAAQLAEAEQQLKDGGFGLL